jgi:hypothetical protein
MCPSKLKKSPNPQIESQYLNRCRRVYINTSLNTCQAAKDQHGQSIFILIYIKN